MAVQGNLKDMNLTSLISVNCNEMNQARLRIVNQHREARLFFEAGNIVHASLAGREGPEVVYEVLGWNEGQFVLEPDVAPPGHSIDVPWSELLLNGLHRIDELAASDSQPASTSDELEAFVEELDATERQEKDRNPATLAAMMKGINGVSGAVVVARDGIVLASELDGDPDKEGAVAVFVGSAASQIGQALDLGPFLSGVVEIGSERTRMVVLEQPDFYLGLLLDERASPALALQRAEGLLAWEGAGR